MLELLKKEDLVDKKAVWGDLPFWKAKSRIKQETESMVGIFETTGGETLIEDGLIKAVQGLVSIEEVVRASS
jgi:hypothetical protein